MTKIDKDSEWEAFCRRCSSFVAQDQNAVLCEEDGCTYLVCAACACVGLPAGVAADALHALPPLWCPEHDPSRHDCIVVDSDSGDDSAGHPRAQPPPSQRQRQGARRTARTAPVAAVAAAADDSADAVTASLGALRATVSDMTPERAWEWVEASRALASSPPRRYLPGTSAAGVIATYSRRLAAAAFLILLEMAADGDAAAQILCLHLPRIILRRDCEIPGQIAALAADTIPPISLDSAQQPARDVLKSWCMRLRYAHANGDSRRAFELALVGPEDLSVSSLAEASPALDRLFPHKASGEVPGNAESAEWRAAADAHIAAAPTPTISAVDLLKWARRHKDKAADAGGWTGRLVVELHATEPLCAAALARFWSLPPGEIRDPRARNFALRSCNGVLLRREGKDPRPIAAPNMPRKVLSACDARRARAAAAAFCEQRGQVGLSSGGALLAYSLFPRLVVEMGGTTCSADNTSSFQNFTRRGLLDGARAFFASSEARELHPLSATSFARVMDVCVFDTPTLTRTCTHFHGLHTTRTSHALAQGCSSSPTAEAITLAAAPRPPPSHRAIRKGAHDDSQASGLPGCSVDAFAPPPEWGGAQFNTAKSVAVGTLADAIVSRGYASSAARFSTVFGAPVGDVAAWVESVWVPRFRKVIANLRHAAACDPEAAILAANCIKGPGGSAAHWLRTTPVPLNSPAWRALAAMDDEWVRLWVFFAGIRGGATPTDGSTNATLALSSEELCACWDRVFGTGAACLSHVSATWTAAKSYAAGCADAWPYVARWSSEMAPTERGLWRDFARTLGVDARVVDAPGATPDSVGQALRRAAASAAAAYDTLTAAAAARVAQRTPTAALGRGAQACEHSEANRHPNLLVAALGRSTGHAVATGDLTPEGLRDYAGLAVAMIFGLPIWGALGMGSRPTHCRHCLAPATAAAASNLASAPRALPAAAPHATRPQITTSARKVLDDFGSHALVCNASGVLAGAKWRHDSFVRDLAHVSSSAGCKGRYHDGPCFTFGPKQRPCDLLQRPPHLEARYPSGEGVDATIGLREVSGANERETEKQQKFAAQLRRHPQLGFQPFGVTLDGDIGTHANAVIATWCRTLAAQAAARKLPPGDPRGEVITAVARAFVRSTIFQLVQWKLYDRKVSSRRR